MFKRIGIGFTLACAVVLAGATLVFAHARYESSTPAADSTVAALPSTVAVTFSDELRAVTLTVLGPDGSTVSTAAASIDLADRDNATVPVRDGGAGRYTVQWTSVSDDDGESDAGSFGFTVSSTGAAAPAPTPAPPTPAAAATACPTTDRPDPGMDERVDTYCERQQVRDKYRGQIDEATFNGEISEGATLEDALHEAMEHEHEHDMGE